MRHLVSTTAAVRLLEMNAKLYPTSANVFAGLGDVWLAKKDTVKALAFFEKAVALRPGLQRAKEMTRKLKSAP